MANAARIHAIESGKTFEGRTVIAFGGGGPVHACRVAEKIGADRIMVPPGAGVGSAIGFLRAPVGYEVVRSLYGRLGRFDGAAVGRPAGRRWRGRDAAVVEPAASAPRPAPSAPPSCAMSARATRSRSACPTGRSRATPAASAPAFDAEYARFYDRPVPGSDVEVMSFAVSVATETTGA